MIHLHLAARARGGNVVQPGLACAAWFDGCGMGWHGFEIQGVPMSQTPLPTACVFLFLVLDTETMHVCLLIRVPSICCHTLQLCTLAFVLDSSRWGTPCTQTAGSVAPCIQTIRSVRVAEPAVGRPAPASRPPGLRGLLLSLRGEWQTCALPIDCCRGCESFCLATSRPVAGHGWRLQWLRCRPLRRAIESAVGIRARSRDRSL
jgi:hypothetical protein